MVERDPGDEGDQRRRDLVLEAVEQLIGEAEDMGLEEDRGRLEGLLALRTRLLAEGQRDAE